MLYSNTKQVQWQWSIKIICLIQFKTITFWRQDNFKIYSIIKFCSDGVRLFVQYLWKVVSEPKTNDSVTYRNPERETGLGKLGKEIF